MAKALNIRNKVIEHILKFLAIESPSPVYQDRSLWKRTSIQYSLDKKRIQGITDQRTKEWQQVLAYVDHKECLMNFLQRALDDEVLAACGNCANCLRKGFPSKASSLWEDKAVKFLLLSEFELKCPKKVPPGNLMDLTEQGYLLPQFQAKRGRVLCRWGDAGLGTLVMEQKRRGVFLDDTLTALTEMIRLRWNPKPFPKWITCVPSLRHPELVPDFTRRLAAKLDLPFHDVVTKARQNEAQKSMQNPFHQCANLDGAFSISIPLPEGPVLLVDDVVDSGWTMSIIAAQLRQAGSSMVYPVALASTAPN